MATYDREWDEGITSRNNDVQDLAFLSVCDLYAVERLVAVPERVAIVVVPVDHSSVFHVRHVLILW